MTPRRSIGPPAGHSRALVKRQRSATHGLLRLLGRAGRIIDIIAQSRARYSACRRRELRY